MKTIIAFGRRMLGLAIMLFSALILLGSVLKFMEDGMQDLGVSLAVIFVMLIFASIGYGIFDVNRTRGASPPGSEDRVNKIEQQYLDDIMEYLTDDGIIDEKERRLLDRERTKLGISRERADELERSVAIDGASAPVQSGEAVPPQEVERVSAAREKNENGDDADGGGRGILASTVLLPFKILWFFIKLPFLIVFFPFRLLFGKKVYCAWCGKKNIECTKDVRGQWVWKYRNKGGGRDKRVKDNFQTASYESFWNCKDCGAATYVMHFMSRNPSVRAKPAYIMLNKRGSGERRAEDKSFGGEAVDPTKENRIGKRR